ncbi:uncharacterized protein LOC118585437 isoform X2 [Onychomys torridus]|uniref:uncharacterized protein LOC118585437 isoform X2 n=1 Tax=Onychomys torridus TaxID=38674 RepID=UPI00167F803D|nr:uncharacterized protein LOC118585437 isoform X2 [Onychomys torridus]
MDRRCYVSVSGTRSHPPLHKRRRAGRDPRRRQRRRRSHAPASPLRLTEARSSRLEAGSPIAHRWMSSEEARISGFGGDAVIPCHTDSSEKPTLLNGWTPNAPSMDSVMEKLLRWAGGCSTLPPSLCPVDVWTSDVQHHGQLLVASGSASSTQRCRRLMSPSWSLWSFQPSVEGPLLVLQSSMSQALWNLCSVKCMRTCKPWSTAFQPDSPVLDTEVAQSFSFLALEPFPSISSRSLSLSHQLLALHG